MSETAGRAARIGGAVGRALALAVGTGWWVAWFALGGLLSHSCGHPQTAPLEARIELLEAGSRRFERAAVRLELEAVEAELEAARAELAARGRGLPAPAAGKSSTPSLR